MNFAGKKFFLSRNEAITRENILFSRVFKTFTRVNESFTRVNLEKIWVIESFSREIELFPRVNFKEIQVIKLFSRTIETFVYRVFIIFLLIETEVCMLPSSIPLSEVPCLHRSVVPVAGCRVAFRDKRNDFHRFFGLLFKRNRVIRFAPLSS
jgi:hypothetical protein